MKRTGIQQEGDVPSSATGANTPGDQSELARALARMAWPPAVLLTVLTAAWILTLIFSPDGPAGAGLAEQLQFIGQHEGRQVLIGALVVPLALLMVPVWIALAGLTWHLRPGAAVLAVAFGLLYVPFVSINYWTQLTVVRGLARLYETDPEAAVTAYRLLEFPGGLQSTMYALDVFGYAVWGLAGLAIAAGLVKLRDRLARATGVLFALTGVLAVGGATGFVIQHAVLESGVLLSGITFLFSVAAAGWLLLRYSRERVASP